MELHDVVRVVGMKQNDAWQIDFGDLKQGIRFAGNWIFFKKVYDFIFFTTFALPN